MTARSGVTCQNTTRFTIIKTVQFYTVLKNGTALGKGDQTPAPLLNFMGSGGPPHCLATTIQRARPVVAACICWRNLRHNTPPPGSLHPGKMKKGHGMCPSLFQDAQERRTFDLSDLLFNFVGFRVFLPPAPEGVFVPYSFRSLSKKER